MGTLGGSKKDGELKRQREILVVEGEANRQILEGYLVGEVAGVSTALEEVLGRTMDVILSSESV